MRYFIEDFVWTPVAVQFSVLQMKKESTDGVALAVFALFENDARKATHYIGPKHVVTATRRHKPDGRDNRVEVLLKIGAPNYREREFIKACKKANEPFPVRKVQLKFWPEAKKKTKGRKC